MMKSLSEIYNRYKTEGDVGFGDKGTVHSYIEKYDELFSPYRTLKIELLEIGVAMGNSLRMWNEYFIRGTVTGVDVSIMFDATEFLEKGINVIEADATKEIAFTNQFDIIIDDGSHLIADQTKSFEVLFPRMNTGGIYVIEDVLDLRTSEPILRALHPSCEIHDLRHIKNRFDDVLVVYRK